MNINELLEYHRQKYLKLLSVVGNGRALIQYIQFKILINSTSFTNINRIFKAIGAKMIVNVNGHPLNNIYQSEKF
jgi:predicted site-specific integrase-resolvase